MDKLKNIRIIKTYFLHCFNEEVDVIYDVKEGYYKIGDREINLENDEFKFIIFPLKDKFLQWGWDTKIEADFLDDEFIFNDFHSCLEAIIKFQLKNHLHSVKNMIMFGMLEDDYDDKNPFGT